MEHGNIKHNGELRDSRRERGESLYLGAVVGFSFDGSPSPQAELETCWQCHGDITTASEGLCMRVYLDNCCYNRPFDDQTQVKVRMETEAKLLVQSMMRTGVVEYAWSFMLRMESSRNPDPQRKHAVTAWANGAAVDVAPTDEIGARAHEFEALGVKPSDAIHLACAESASCDWFFTVDRGILKKISNVGSMRVANPVDFVLEGST